MRKIVLLCISLFVFLLVGCMGITTSTDTTYDQTTSLPTGDTSSQEEETTTTTEIVSEDEIVAIELILANLEIEAPEDFAYRLVENGMDAADFQIFMDAVPLFKETIDTSNGDPTVINTALKAFLGNGFNYRALFSAMISVLVDQLDQEIAYYLEEIIFNIDDDSYVEFCQEEILRYQTLKYAIIYDEENIIQVAVNTAEYLDTFQAAVSNEMITNIISLQQSETINLTEALIVKDEVIAVLQENIPEAAEIELLYQLIISMETAFTGELDVFTQLYLLSGQSSETLVLSIEIILEFIGSIDETLVNDIGLILSGSEQPIVAKEMILYVANYLEAFVASQPVLFGEIQAMFTEADIEALYDSFIWSLEDIMILSYAPDEVINVVLVLTENLTYEILTGATDVVAKLAGNLITYFRESDGVLVDYIVAINNGGGSPEAWALVKELLNYVDVELSSLTSDDVAAVLTLIVAILPTELSYEYMGLTMEQSDMFIEAVFTAINNQSENALTLMNNLVDYLILNQKLSEIESIISTFTDPLTGGPTVQMFIYTTNELSTYLNTENVEYVNSIMGELFATLNDPYVQGFVGLTTEQLLDIQLLAEADFANFLVLINEVKALDPAATTLDNASIQNLIIFIQGILPQEPQA